jgi:phosphomannomutase
VTLDGVKAVFDDYTLLIRASTTEPKVRLNSEAKTREKALAGMALAKELVAKCPG